MERSYCFNDDENALRVLIGTHLIAEVELSADDMQRVDDGDLSPFETAVMLGLCPAKQ